MSDQENATENANAVEVTESAPVNQLEEAVNTESAPVVVDANDQTTEKEESEPQSKAVKELIAQRKRRQAAEQDAAYWRGVAEARNAPESKPVPVQQKQETDLKPPKSDDFDTWEEFEVAKDQHLVEKAKAEMRREFQQQQVKQHQVKVETSFWDKVSSIEEKEDPYIRETIVNVGKMVNPVVADLVVASDDGIELVKYLNNNPKEAKRLSGLSPLMAAKEIGKLEAGLANKPKPEPIKKVSQAPTPIKTVTPSGNTSVFDPETATMDEYYARRMSQLRPSRK